MFSFPANLYFFFCEAMPCQCPCNNSTPSRQCGLDILPRTAMHRCACVDCGRGYSGCHVRIQWSERYCWVCEGTWRDDEKKKKVEKKKKRDEDEDEQQMPKKKHKKQSGESHGCISHGCISQERRNRLGQYASANHELPVLQQAMHRLGIALLTEPGPAHA